MRTYLIVILLLIFASNKAQETIDLELSYSKSLFLVFSEHPSFVPGSEALLVEAVDNKLIIQAAKRNFETTNLMVEVGTKFYLFNISYSETPEKFFYNFQVNTTKKDPEVTTGSNNESTDEIKKDDQLTDYSKLEKQLEEKAYNDSIDNYFTTNCQAVLDKPIEHFNIGAVKYKYVSQVKNVCTDGKYFYVRYSFQNKANVAFHLDYQSFMIIDKKGKLKKAGFAEVEKTPVYIHDQIKVINPGETKEMIIVFEKFTIDKRKLFEIEVWEENGDRRMLIYIDDKTLLNVTNI